MDLGAATAMESPVSTMDQQVSGSILYLVTILLINFFQVISITLRLRELPFPMSLVFKITTLELQTMNDQENVNIFFLKKKIVKERRGEVKEKAI